MLLLGIAHGLGTSLLGIRATIEGFTDLQAGVALSAYYLGFLAGSRFIAVMLANVGHIRVFSGLAALASVVMLLHSVLLLPVVWFLLRLLSGFCMSGIYVTADSWLNNRVTNQNRGRILGIYMMMGMGGAALGQLFIGVADPGGFILFMGASMLFSLSLVPLSLTRIDPPEVPERRKANILAVYRTTPLALVGTAAAGLTIGSISTLGPVYGAQVGLSSQQVGWVMGALMFGSVAMIPLGRLSDRIPRRRVILAITVGAFLLCMLMSTGPLDPALFGLVMLAYGAFTYPVYALSMSHMNDCLDRSQMVAGMAALVTFMGLGAAAGPILSSGLMSLVGPDGLWMALGTFHGGFAVYTIIRFVERPRIPNRMKRAFVPIPIRSSARIARLIRRKRRRPTNCQPQT